MADYILIVEDDNDIDHMLSELLSSQGYRTASAYSGAEALFYIEKETPATVILDLMLPGMTGEELLSRIKDTDVGISVIVSSAKDDVRTRVELFRAGANKSYQSVFCISKQLTNQIFSYIIVFKKIQYNNAARYIIQITKRGNGWKNEITGQGRRLIWRWMCAGVSKTVIMK